VCTLIDKTGLLLMMDAVDDDRVVNIRDERRED